MKLSSILVLAFVLTGLFGSIMANYIGGYFLNISAVLVLVVLVGFFVARFVSKPIKKIAADVDEITKGKLDIQLEKSNIFEIQKLTDSLNRILASLKLAILKTGVKGSELGLGEAIKAKELAEEEFQKLASVVTHTTELVNLATPDGKMIFINEAGSKILGIDPGDVEKYNIRDFVPKYLLGTVDKDLIPALSKGKNWEGELECKNIKTNELTPVYAITFPILDSKTGIIKYFANISSDISERKNTEEKYRSLYEGSQDAIMTLEPPKWKFTAGNPAAVKMFRAKDEAEFISKTPGDLSPVKQSDGKLSKISAKEMIEKAMKEGLSSFYWIHKRINGEEFSAQVNLTKVKIKNKDVLQATVRDVSMPSKEGLVKTKEMK